jgi:hypothetical protein
VTGESDLTEERPSLRGPLLATLGLASVGVVVVAAVVLVGVLRGERPVGDGRDPSTYGFEIDGLERRPGFAASGLPRDFMPALDDPETIRGDEVAVYNATHRRRPVVSADRVVGVTIGNESRAYPLSLLEVHEVVNDRLGDVPIAISFSPLADAVIVVVREVDGTPVRFGLSGLMLDATHLLYDRGAPDAASLWSPIRRRAMSGPRAGTALELVTDVAVLSWRDWLATHPDTTVALGDEGSRLRNRRVDYAHYRDDDTLPMPVEGLERLAPDERKRPVVAVRSPGGSWRVVPLEALRDGEMMLDGDLAVNATVDANSRTVHLSADIPLEVVPCMRFATLPLLEETTVSDGGGDGP